MNVGSTSAHAASSGKTIESTDFKWLERNVKTFISYTEKGQAVPVHATKACRGSRDITPLILNVGTRWN
jgi:hypothetical protein